MAIVRLNPAGPPAYVTPTTPTTDMAPPPPVVTPPPRQDDPYRPAGYTPGVAASAPPAQPTSAAPAAPPKYRAPAPPSATGDYAADQRSYQDWMDSYGRFDDEVTSGRAGYKAPQAPAQAAAPAYSLTYPTQPPAPVATSTASTQGGRTDDQIIAWLVSPSAGLPPGTPITPELVAAYRQMGGESEMDRAALQRNAQDTAYRSAFDYAVGVRPDDGSAPDDAAARATRLDPRAAYLQFVNSGYTGQQALGDGWATGNGQPGWAGMVPPASVTTGVAPVGPTPTMAPPDTIKDQSSYEAPRPGYQIPPQAQTRPGYQIPPQQPVAGPPPYAPPPPPPIPPPRAPGQVVDTYRPPAVAPPPRFPPPAAPPPGAPPAAPPPRSAAPPPAAPPPYNPTATPNMPGQPVTDFTYPVAARPSVGPATGKRGAGTSRNTARDLGSLE